MKKLILICFLTASSIVSNAQLSPNFIFDTLVDQHGGKYALKNLLVNPGPNPDPEQIAATSVSCTAGYFRLYFAIGSGFDGNTAVEINRRAVLCQLFTDLSCFIKSPLSSPCVTTTNTTTFVNVLVDNNPGGLAAGTTMFAVPPNPAVGACIQDNLAYKTITSGVDAYTNVTAPVLFNPGFYHMMMKFNTSTVQWYLDMTSITNILPNEFDLYSAGLHEALHCLGFASLIGPSGAPVNGSFNFYSRYDLRLTASNSVTPLLTTTNTSCSFSNMQWNPILPTATTVKPANCINGAAQTDNTPCGTACKYVSTSTSMTVAVYTPTCYEPGGSLSHFEEQCYPTAPAGNNQYFLMSNAYGGPNNGIKRYPREEEKIALCDIGYSVSSQYVSPVVGAPFTYTSGACNPPNIWGVNDGIVNNNFVFVGSTQINIPITASVLANDSPNAIQADCISFVYNYPSLNLSVTGGSIVLTYTPGPILCPGLVLLQYIPKDASGNPGNITYIYAYFQCGSCSPVSPCGLVQNGGFENVPLPNSCQREWIPSIFPFCWESHCFGFPSPTPDLYNMNPACATATQQSSLLDPFVQGNHAISTTYNGFPPNNRCAALVGTYNAANQTYVEVIKTDLGTAMVPTQTYVLSFWAFNSQGIYNPFGLPTVISFASRVNMASLPFANYPANENVIATFTLPASDINTWKQYTTTVVFTNTNSANHKCLIVGPNPLGTKAVNPSVPSYSTYTFIDDVSLIDLGNALLFGPPPVVCDNTCLVKLSQYANQANVVFSGPFVSLNAGDYDFCPNGPGNYTVTASYTNNVGCTYSTQAVIAVPGLSIVPSNTLWCNYLNYTLTAVAIPSNIASPFPLWQPQNINASQVVVSGNNQTTYLASANINGCPVVAVFDPTIVPNTIVTSTPDIWCATPNAAYTMTVSLPNFTLPITVTQTWSPPISSNASVVSVSYSNIINPTYTVNTTAGGCTNIATFTATWVPSPTIAIIGGTNCLTAGQTVTLLAVTPSTLPLTYTWQPGNATTSSIVVTPTANTIYSLLTSYSNCALTSTIGLYVPPQFTNVPASICSGSSFSYLQNLLASGTPTTGTFTGFGTYTTLVGPNILTSFSVPVTSAPGPYSVVYSYVTPANCTVTNTLVLTVAQGVSLTIPNPTVTYCPNIAVGASVVAIATPSTGVTYLWNPGNITTSSFVATPSVSTDYTLIASIGSCSAIGRVYVNVNNNCCASANYINVSSVTNQTFIGLYAINQDLTINGSVVFGGEFLVAKDVSITVVPGATLASNFNTGGTVPNPVHMRSCADMWSGIYVQNGGKNIFFHGDLIEDALDGIVSNGCTSTSGLDIDMDGVAFNRNYRSIQILNYNQTTGTPPFRIHSCIFTCRDLGIPLNSLTWPNATQLKAASGPTNTLNSPYLVLSTPTANCKPPISTRPSLIGVFVVNSGLTANPTATNSTYFSINIADPSVPSWNLFDNQIMSLWAFNSNVNSYANIYQNSRRWQLTPTIFLGGYGIYGSNDNNGPNKNTRVNLVNPITPSVSPNIFYDCHIAVGGMHLFELNCQWQDFRSTQSSAVAFNNNLRGQYGIWCISNRIKTYTITNNVFQNVRTGVRVGMVNGPLNLPSIPNFGTYLGKTTISNNLFSPTIGTVAPVGTGFIYYGVYVDAALNPAFNTFYAPGAALQITTNNFSRVYRGSFVGNSSNNIYITTNANNRITMISDANTPLASQYGIQHVQNRNDIVNTNTIIGTAATYLDPRVAGVYRNANTIINSTQCNSVQLVYAGFHFAGSNIGSIWRSNRMQNVRRGLQMTNNAIISQQGTATAPSDNLWIGSWAGNNGTWTDNSTFPVNSKLAIRTLANYFPPNNSNQSFIAAQTYVLGPGTVIFANNNAPIFNCFPSPPPCTTCNPIVSSMNDIVTNNVTYSLNVQETEEINKELVYKDLAMEPTLMDSSAILSSFYSANTASTLGTFNTIENNLGQGNSNLVASILAALNPNTNIENNNKIFYDIYNNYLQNDNLSVSDRLALLILAHQCPFTDGPIVYQARSLHSIITQEVKPYYDVNCEDNGFSRAANDSSSQSASEIELESLLLANERTTQTKFKRSPVYDIYPNPASDLFSIISNIKSEKLEVRILDLSGKLLLKKHVITNNYLHEIPVSLINGIYFVNLISESGVKTVKKLIISK